MFSERVFLPDESVQVGVRHGVAHIYNNWADVPSVGEQMTLPGSLTNPGAVRSALPARAGAQVAGGGEPTSLYDRVKEANAEARAAGARLIREGVGSGRVLEQR